MSSIAICPAEYGGFGLTFEWETARFGIAKRQLLKFPLRTVARVAAGLEYYREGSYEKHLRDIRAMLAVSGGQLDRPALES